MLGGPRAASGRRLIGLVAEALDPEMWEWPTAGGRPTSLAGRLDHILLSGLRVVPGSVEVVRNVRGASDHKPLRIEAVLAH